MRPWALDHLVIGAASLAQAAAWCRARLACEPAAGGQHALMGTHNLLLNLSSDTHPRCYLEFIAIDPQAAPVPRRRWFGLDEPAVQQQLAEAPRLLHWVARCDDIAAARAQALQQGWDPGEPTAAARGDFRWTITLRADGLPQGGGRLPALIQWQAGHPADRLPPSRWRLQAFEPEAGRATLAGAAGPLILEF